MKCDKCGGSDLFMCFTSFICNVCEPPKTVSHETGRTNTGWYSFYVSSVWIETRMEEVDEGFCEFLSRTDNREYIIKKDFEVGTDDYLFYGTGVEILANSEGSEAHENTRLLVRGTKIRLP